MSDQGTLHTIKPWYSKVPVKLLHDTSITDGAVRLYAHMHWRFGKSHKNFEGRESMAQIMGVSEATISKRIRELEGAGWIVVIERTHSTSTGNYLTPFYHIFESRKMAVEFRATCTPVEGEVIRVKPTKIERKSRKGKGGKPSHKKVVPTEETQVDHVNSSLHGADNSSLRYLESVDLAIKDVPDGNAPIFPANEPVITSVPVEDVNPVEIPVLVKPAKGQTFLEANPGLTPEQLAVIRQQTIDEQVEKERLKLERNTNLEELKKLITETIGLGGTVALQYAKMLMDMEVRHKGTLNNEYNFWRIPGGITPTEFRTWVAYYQRTQRTVKDGTDMNLKTPEKLYGYITGWIEAGKPDITRPVQTEQKRYQADWTPDLDALYADQYWTDDNQYLGAKKDGYLKYQAYRQQQQGGMIPPKASTGAASYPGLML